MFVDTFQYILKLSNKQSCDSFSLSSTWGPGLIPGSAEIW